MSTTIPNDPPVGVNMLTLPAHTLIRLDGPSGPRAIQELNENERVDYAYILPRRFKTEIACITVVSLMHAGGSRAPRLEELGNHAISSSLRLELVEKVITPHAKVAEKNTLRLDFASYVREIEIEKPWAVSTFDDVVKPFVYKKGKDDPGVVVTWAYYIAFQLLKWVREIHDSREALPELPDIHRKRFIGLYPVKALRVGGFIYDPYANIITPILLVSPQTAICKDTKRHPGF
ncbi:hypothetical protein CC1G_13470 [Coprinopsis cinerea okayama7|uniref:Uncharacterized protein n=1 Tax=Coprinopsis cinerea (strain Okayama-7 / 130 / ATCC MYA-4618 / FGSC 9003) TaxID=240176 RepID=A8PIN8_COPC7|nr:hypothetical protein CC1G_13470 [Coprinopsis cinerea okayama7\|eukprot:XP_001841600.2 hypothetical protein CC1G_13470 [Coprinopsis cinerea okayama7\